MAKKVLNAADLFRLRASLQVATLGAIMASRRWAPGELAFQGGTCLSLVYGSERFSEDLDFMVRGGMSLQGLERAVERLLVLPPDVPSGLRVQVSVAKEERQLHAFTVSLSGASYIGSAKVKVELWPTAPHTLDSLTLVVKPVRSAAGTQAHVPAESLEEIMADKVYALGARDRLKPRDVFDLWWMSERSAGDAVAFDEQAFLKRVCIYPRGDEAATARAWLDSACERMESMQGAGVADFVSDDLKKWLPSSWPMDAKVARTMVDSSLRYLQNGIDCMEATFGHVHCPRPRGG